MSSWHPSLRCWVQRVAAAEKTGSGQFAIEESLVHTLTHLLTNFLWKISPSTFLSSSSASSDLIPQSPCRPRILPEEVGCIGLQRWRELADTCSEQFVCGSNPPPHHQTLLLIFIWESLYKILADTCSELNLCEDASLHLHLVCNPYILYLGCSSSEQFV